MKGALKGEPVMDFPEPVFIGEDALADGSVYNIIPRPPGFDDVQVPTPAPTPTPTTSATATPSPTPTKSGN
jgi:hypothetical protein